MCTGAELIPIIIAATGTATGAVAQQRALKEQDRETARGIMRQAELSRKASGEIGEQIETIKKSTPDAEREAAQGDFMIALRRARGANKPNAPGGGSARFAEGSAAAAEASDTEGEALAGQLARIDAPGLQRVREGQGTGDLASRLSLIDRDAQGQDFLARLRAGSIQPNPFVTGVGRGLQAFGRSAAGRLPAADSVAPPRRLFRFDPQIINDTPIGTTTVFGG